LIWVGFVFGANSEQLVDKMSSAEKSTQSSDQGDLITFVLGVGIRGPIISGTYRVGTASITVSYPAQIDFGFPTPIILPKALSTVFEVSWRDTSHLVAQKLLSKKPESQFPILDVLEKINELLLAYKLVCVGNGEGHGLRTVGKHDLLFSLPFVNGKQVDFSMGLRAYRSEYSWALPRSIHPEDPSGTTNLAKPHISMATYPVARRYVRCFELLEHGYYTEAVIVAFSVLDDLVQQVLHDHMSKNGMASKKDRNALLRGIKEQRLKLYLGQVLKILTGKSLQEMWPEAPAALDWLNSTRNKVAHQGYRADSTAAKAIYVCIKVLVVLHQNQILHCEFPVEMFRHAKIIAAWTENPPAWVPQDKMAESFDFE